MHINRFQFLCMMGLAVLLAGCDLQEDSTSEDSKDKDDPVVTSIYAIRTHTVAVGTKVTIKNAIAISSANETSTFVFANDQYAYENAGIMICAAEGLKSTLAIGDVIDVTGTYEETEGQSQIVLQDAQGLAKTGKQNTIPRIPTVTTEQLFSDLFCEKYEGMLLKIEDALVTERNSDSNSITLDDRICVDAALNAITPLPVESDKVIWLIGIVHCDKGVFKLSPRGSYDYFCSTSIASIRQGNTPVNTEVVITKAIAVMKADSASKRLFVQSEGPDEIFGIMVYSNNGIGMTIEIGDRLEISGKYRQYFGQAELEIDTADSMTKTGSSIPVFPEIISEDTLSDGTLCEKYEGKLVRIDSLSVASSNATSKTFTTVKGIVVGSVLCAIALPANGTAIASLTGVVHHSDDEYFIEPRTEADIAY